ncbi:MAG TPA: hypothetical protein VK717_13230 [Opitutaceae bacterium]|nr:hypothetical protein [Opitutaceae bacterium]
MHDAIYQKLVDFAKTAKLTFYSEIAPLADLSMDLPEDRAKISEILEEIGRHEEKEDRPMLTAIVIHAGGDNNPGNGFFELAKSLGRYGGSKNEQRRVEFWVKQVAETHAFWQKKPNQSLQPTPPSRRG